MVYLLEKLNKCKQSNVAIVNNNLQVQAGEISKHLPYIERVTADYVLIKNDVQNTETYVLIKNLNGIIFQN